MPERDYEIEANPIIPQGFVPDQLIEVSGDDPGELADLMLKMSAVLELVGGTFSVVAIRREIAPGLWVPDRFAAKWSSYAPGGSLRRQEEDQAAAEPQRQPAPAPEPVAEEQPEPEPVADPSLTADPDVDPAPPASTGFDMGTLVPNVASQDVLAEV